MATVDKKDQLKKIELLEGKTSQSRKEWMIKINETIQLLNDVTKISDAQVKMLSYRHMIVDKRAELKNTLARLKSFWEECYKLAYEEVVTNNLKLKNGTERDNFVKAELSVIKRQIAILENHVQFYDECIVTCDKISFAIKNKINIATDL